MLADDPIAVAATDAIQSGDLVALARLLASHVGLAAETIGDPATTTRTLLHAATDWPGHFPNNAESVKMLIAAGGDVNARFRGPHSETPLHWAASSDDAEIIDVLLDAGADIEADGAVIAGGTPLMDAVAFGQWKAARRLVERGAHVPLRQAAALGLLDRVVACCGETPAPEPEDITQAFWYACHGGQQPAAELLLSRGADLNWVSVWDHTTPLDAAEREGAGDVVEWLRSHGGRSVR